MHSLPSAVPSDHSSVLAIRADSLCRRFGNRWALRNVSFELERGKSLLVAGRNGSGKSTLFRVLTTAVRAHRGTAAVAGYSLSDQEAVRSRVALLTHQSYLYDSLGARENLMIAARLLDRNAARVDALLVEVGLSERAAEPVSSYSAGMRKRLSFARLLLQDAEIIFLDEPYGQLDPPGALLVDRTLQRLRSEGKTLVIASHLLERASRFCDSALVLDSGAISWRGAPADAAQQFAPLEGGESFA